MRYGNGYSRGRSEKIIGDFLHHGTGKRDRAVLATKFFMNLFAGDPNGGGAGRKAIIAQCEEPLRRLRTDSIDLSYLHNWDRFMPIEETMRALDDLVQSGKVRYVGISERRRGRWRKRRRSLIGELSCVRCLRCEQRNTGGSP